MLTPNARPNKANEAELASWVFIEGMQLAKVVKIRGNQAGKVGVVSRLGLYSKFDYRLGWRRAAAEIGRWAAGEIKKSAGRVDKKLESALARMK